MTVKIFVLTFILLIASALVMKAMVMSMTNQELARWHIYDKIPKRVIFTELVFVGMVILFFIEAIILTVKMI